MRRPVGIAYDQRDNELTVVCSDGAVFSWDTATRAWMANHPIPGTVAAGEKDDDRMGGMADAFARLVDTIAPKPAVAAQIEIQERLEAAG